MSDDKRTLGDVFGNAFDQNDSEDQRNRTADALQNALLKPGLAKAMGYPSYGKHHESIEEYSEAEIRAKERRACDAMIAEAIKQQGYEMGPKELADIMQVERDRLFPKIP